MNITLDVKTLLTIAGIIAILGGFYYTTQHRLTLLEEKILYVSGQIDNQTKDINQVKKQLRKK